MLLPADAGTPVHIAAGHGVSLVATSSGKVYSFGVNNRGQLGFPANNGENPTPTPIALPGQVGTIVALAAGSGHSLVATSSGQLYSFGTNGVGELGRAADIAPHLPELVALPGLSRAVRLAASSIISLGGMGYSLVVTADGKLYAFGDNRYGQLGIAANFGPNPVPTEVELPGRIGGVTQVSALQEASLVQTSSGQLYSFGGNFRGQLGRPANSGTNTPNPTPALVELPVGMGADGLGPAETAEHAVVILRKLLVLDGSLPDGRVGVPYDAALQAGNGFAPLVWSASGLPPGLSIDPGSGAITGTPTSEGSFAVTITVTDAHGGVASKQRTIAIGAAPSTPSPPVATPTPDPVPAPPIPLPLACSGKDLVLLDVHLERGRVVVGGVALPKDAGQRATIAPVARRAASASTAVRPDGTFEARLKPPARARREKIRYRAMVAGKRSAALKLIRQFVITGQKLAPSGLRLQARVSRGRRGQKVTLQRQLSCSSGRTVTTAKLSCRGEFSVLLVRPAPPSPLAFYRAIAKLGRARTFTLPIAVRAAG